MIRPSYSSLRKRSGPDPEHRHTSGQYGIIRCSQEQYAVYIPDRNVILLLDAGVVMSPITPEGPFPETNNVLTINLKAPLKHSIGKRLEMERDFTVEFDYATDGYIEIHEDKVVINLKYSSEYWENHNGTIPLQES